MHERSVQRQHVRAENTIESTEVKLGICPGPRSQARGLDDIRLKAGHRLYQG